jgi:hypothetical protein
MKDAPRREIYAAVMAMKHALETLDRVLPTEEAEAERLANQFKARRGRPQARQEEHQRLQEHLASELREEISF